VKILIFFSLRSSRCASLPASVSGEFGFYFSHSFMPLIVADLGVSSPGRRFQRSS
jgi:hypothetical protein